MLVCVSASFQLTFACYPRLCVQVSRVRSRTCLNQLTFVCVSAGFTCAIEDLSVRDLLPQTKHYITYEGSTTLPGCWETTTWVLSNKPIYLAPAEVRQQTLRVVPSASARIRAAALSAVTRPDRSRGGD